MKGPGSRRSPRLVAAHAARAAAGRAARAAVQDVLQSQQHGVGTRRVALRASARSLAAADKSRRRHRRVSLAQSAGPGLVLDSVAAKRGPQGQGRFLVATRAVVPAAGKRKARTSKMGGRPRPRRASILLLREEIGASVRYSKTLAAAQARAQRLLRTSGPEAGQAREVVKCGGRWYCAADLVAAGSKAVLAQQFIKGQEGQPPECNAMLRLRRENGTRTVRLSAVRPIRKGDYIAVRYGGSAARRVVAAVHVHVAVTVALSGGPNGI
jgi:hypothetical protein